MRRPSFQFYPADWRGNAKLRRCSRAERGDWIELICLLHDSEEYGLLRWPLKDIAQAIGCPVAHLKKGLVAKGVLKGADTDERCRAYIYIPRHAGKDGPPVVLIAEQAGPLWYSSRMVRDAYLASTRGAATRFGASPEETRTYGPGDAPRAAPSRREGDGASSSTSSSSSVKPQQQRAAAAAVEKRLVPPKNLSNGQWALVQRSLKGNADAQLLLDELDGALSTRKVKDPIALLKAFAKQHAAGSFVPSHAHRVQAEREAESIRQEVADARAREGVVMRGNGTQPI